jgi:hypothetical protein
MKTKIDFDRFKNEEWNYIKTIYPKSFSKIREWNFSIDEDNNPYELWFDDQNMYRFFDTKSIYVCPRVNTDNEFYVEVWINGILEFAKHECKDRTEAEVFGFLFAFDYLETKL